MILTVQRMSTSDQGTFGMAFLDIGWNAHSLELPWRNNETGKSCILPGTYNAEWINSPKHGWCYMLKDVPGRTDVEIHSANWAGDASQGLKCQLLGCIALGLSVGVLEGQNAILQSKDAIAQFHSHTNGQPITVIILDAVQ